MAHSGNLILKLPHPFFPPLNTPAPPSLSLIWQLQIVRNVRLSRASNGGRPREVNDARVLKYDAECIDSFDISPARFTPVYGFCLIESHVCTSMTWAVTSGLHSLTFSHDPNVKRERLRKKIISSSFQSLRVSASPMRVVKS